jgi:hypothetical protein
MVDDSVRDVLKKHKFEAVILTGTEVRANFASPVQYL